MDICIENLTKKYGLQRAVDNISFEVKTGEILGFLGPNGAGKTTTMKMITRFLVPDKGDIYIGGRPVREDDGSLKSSIGYLPENTPLYEDMPVIDYLEFCAALQGVAREMIPERVREMVRICGLNREKHKKISELSKGYRQRVGLAQAMIHDPDILILDEPTTGLDPNQIIEIRRLIRDLGREKTVILSTHILPEVEATCDRILIINKGKIVADGTADSLRHQSEGKLTLTVKIEDGDTNEIFEAVRQLPSVSAVDFAGRDMRRMEIQASREPVGQASRELFKLCVEKGWVITEMIPLQQKLEDIFRNLTLN